VSGEARVGAAKHELAAAMRGAAEGADVGHSSPKFRKARYSVVRRLERDALDNQQQRLAETLLARLVALAALADHKVLSDAGCTADERHA
jgi:hypothetical protein